MSTPARPPALTLTGRVEAYIKSLGHTVPGEKVKPAWTAPPPGSLRQLLVDVLDRIDELEEALCDITEDRDMWRARCQEIKQGEAA